MENTRAALVKTAEIKPRRKKYNIPIFVILMIGAVAMIFPFVWMILSSFKTTSDIYTYPPKWLPSTFMPTLPGRLFFLKELAGPLVADCN